MVVSQVFQQVKVAETGQEDGWGDIAIKGVGAGTAAVGLPIYQMGLEDSTYNKEQLARAEANLRSTQRMSGDQKHYQGVVSDMHNSAKNLHVDIPDNKQVRYLADDLARVNKSLTRDMGRSTGNIHELDDLTKYYSGAAEEGKRLKNIGKYVGLGGLGILGTKALYDLATG